MGLYPANVMVYCSGQLECDILLYLWHRMHCRFDYIAGLASFCGTALEDLLLASISEFQSLTAQ